MALDHRPMRKTRTSRSIVIISLTLAALVGPVVGSAQQAGRTFRVAVLHLTSPTPPVDAFRKAMRDLGWLEGQTLLIDYRGADGKAERLDQLAAEVVASRPDVIVTGTSGAAIAAKRATATIPIVMAVSSDPVGLGVVQSLARPGGNITGQAIFSPELSVKRLELLKEALPGLSVWRSSGMLRPPRWNVISNNKYASRYAKGSLVVTLDPDVAAVFPGAREANDALRALAGVIRNHRTRRPSRRSA